MAQPARGHHADRARTARRLKRACFCRHWPPACGQSEARLPPWVLRDAVLPFLAPPPTQVAALLDGFQLSEYAAQLAPLRGVCRAWLALAYFLFDEAHRCLCGVVFVSTQRVKHQQAMRRAVRHGASVRQLTLQLGQRLFNEPRTRSVLDRADWDAFFPSFTSLVRLDLSRLSDALISVVLSVAAQSCQSVKDLELPCEIRSRAADHQELVDTTTVVLDALRHWYVSNGGLRGLSVPAWVTTDAEYARLLNGVAEFCPQIESFRRGSPGIKYGYEPNVPGETWETFCRRCTALRRFTWTAGTFSTQHVALFCVSPKPYMESITLQADSVEWWHDVYDLSPVVALVDAFPRLRVFTVTIQSLRNEHTLPTTALDELTLYVVTQCLTMERLEIGIYTGDRARDALYAIRYVTYERLTRVETLRSVCVCNAALDGELVVTLVNNILERRKQPLKLTLKVIESHSPELVKVLERLAEEPFQWPVELQFEIVISSLPYGGTYQVARVHASEPDPIYAARRHRSELVDMIRRRIGDVPHAVHVETRSAYTADRMIEWITGIRVSLNVVPG